MIADRQKSTFTFFKKEKQQQQQTIMKPDQEVRGQKSYIKAKDISHKQYAMIIVYVLSNTSQDFYLGHLATMQKAP